MKGFVYLMGVGPGDLGLITLKAMEAIRSADVLVYDRLANERLLELNPTAERIYVGKASGNHAVPQEGINGILSEQALMGKVVARIKGGDPLVFGRGGEEALHLKAHGVPFEIIPGISSSIAAPMYAGIPVTHRKVATSFHVITGHESEGESSVNFEALAAVNGTLIFLMGLEKLPHIVAQLLRHGKSIDTPAALVMNGTRNNQRAVYGTLADLEEKGRAAGIGSPAVIVVGPVVGLAEKLGYGPAKGVSEHTVVITRPEGKEQGLPSMLRMAGYHPVVCPSIRTERRSFEMTAEMLSSYGVILFYSSHGVQYFMEGLKTQHVDLRSLKGTIYAIGKKTAAELGRYGIYDVVVPELNSAEGLKAQLTADRAGGTSNGGILSVKGSLAAQVDWQMAASDIELEMDELTVYTTVEACEYVLDDEIHPSALFFASPSAVRSFTNAHEGRPNFNKKQVLAICIGNTTAVEARTHGYLRVEVLASPRPELLVEALENLKKS